MDTRVFHYLTEPPALALLNVIHLFEIEEVQDSVKTLKSRTTADYLHTLIRHLRLPLCRHLCLSDLLVGKTLPLPNELLGEGRFCECVDDAIPWPPRFRHLLSCRAYAACPACHAEGSYTAVGLHALDREDCATKLLFRLVVFRELGCAMDESEPDWKCHAFSSTILADALENWVSWMQYVEDKRYQWKASGETSTSTGVGFLDSVWKLLGYKQSGTKRLS
jgi:hypothetical protein